MYLINGLEQENLSASDRATQYGDGVFTTARIINGHICLNDEHLHRLKKDCEKLFILFTKWNTLRTEMQYLALKEKYGIIKVIISRGIGSRGYSIKNCFNPNRILSTSSYPKFYNKWKNLGITLTLSPLRLGRNAMLAGIKHLNRLEQVLISIYLVSSKSDEALVLDSDGIVTECCSANVFWRKKNNVFTANLSYAGVDGIMRQFCLKQLINSPFQVIEVSEKLENLLDSDEVLICNSIIPIAPVRSFGNKTWKSRKLYKFLAPLCEKAR